MFVAPPCLARACSLLLSGCFIGVLVAQDTSQWGAGTWPGLYRPGMQQGGGQAGQGQNDGVVAWPSGGAQQGSGQTGFPQGSQPRLGFPGVDATTPEFRGFPAFVPGRTGFGNYPGLPGYTPPDKAGADSAVPTGKLRPPGLWPSWLKPGDDDSARAQVDRVLLVRDSERVWYRAADERVYVPLPFYDKLREMGAGGGVQVRTQSGALTVVAHDGATLRANGVCNFELRLLTDDLAEWELVDATRAWLLTRKRATRVRLPDGAMLEAANAHVFFERIDDRMVLRNYGPAIVRLVSPLDTVELRANRQVAIYMTPVARERISTALAVQGTVRARATGRVLELEGGAEGGFVEWAGARVQVGANQTATIDALAGREFPEHRPARRANRDPAERSVPQEPSETKR